MCCNMEKCRAFVFSVYSLQANLLGRRFKRVVVQKLYKNREGVSIKKVLLSAKTPKSIKTLPEVL